MFLVPNHGDFLPFQDLSLAIFFPVGFIKTKHISGFFSHPPLYIESNSLAPYLTCNSS